ncbi:MAG: alpha/beta hydrolase [Thermoanaerobaculia bacterium]|nr:alpha/beta hydrolase [Thermoanaerobaculia bacterium]
MLRLEHRRFVLFAGIAAGLALVGNKMRGEDPVSSANAQSQQAAAPPVPAGAREVPSRMIPVPDTVSPEMQAIIAQPPDLDWNRNVPKTPDEWKAEVQEAAHGVMAGLPKLREALGVTVQPTTIGGVKAFLVTPKVVPSRNRNRVLLHLHGGVRVYNPGEAGTREAILLAGFGGFKVISVDYRMPPDFPYPAALDDAVAVYRDLLKTNKAKNVGIFGTSAGGSLILTTLLRAKMEHLPMPGAIAPGTPTADLTKTGDTLFTNEMVDNSLVTQDGFIRATALLYANGHDLKDPLISPVYGDMHGFPPAILTSGTRDLYLSNTVRVHRKLRAAGVEAVLQLWEGQSHAQYNRDIKAPETREYNDEIARFFDLQLGR